MVFFSQVQDFVTGLVDNTRTSYELEVILNHNPDGETWQVLFLVVVKFIMDVSNPVLTSMLKAMQVGDIQPLERLKLAITYKQKAFVAHSSVQQLLASIWYEGLPGFRRKNVFRQVCLLACRRLSFFHLSRCLTV